MILKIQLYTGLELRVEISKTEGTRGFEGVSKPLRVNSGETRRGRGVF